MNDFLDRHGWRVLEPLAQDGSSRRYKRVAKSGQTAILMETYGQKFGSGITDFIRIGNWLCSVGLKAPEIYATEEAQGLLLLEDFGDTSFKTALENGHDAQELYVLAVDVLKHLAAQDNLPNLPDYYKSHVHAGHRRVIDWYIPAQRLRENPDGLVEEYLGVWKKIESVLPECPQGFLHIDFHAENLMFLPAEKGLKRCGILDFQDAMLGPLPYDLGNLLEDARRDVPENIRSAVLQDYGDGFLAWYRVLTTQFHCRIIGQFVKMAIRDNKTGYLRHIPRVASTIEKALKNPLLKPLDEFFSALKVDFKAPVDMNSARRYIRADAY